MCLAVPGRVVEIPEGQDLAVRTGRIDFAGIRRDICLAFTPEAVVGDYVLVHVGFALSVVDEAEAQRIFRTLEEMEIAAELEGESP